MAQTYDRVAEIAGVADERGNVLLPRNHMAKKTDVYVTLDSGGNFRRAAKDDLQICIPCTEDSASRSGKAIYPHPLHEELGYLAMDENKRKAYLAQISTWSKSHPKVEVVHKYIVDATILDDLQKESIEVDAKTFIRFRVEAGLEDLEPDLWKDPDIAKAWQAHYSKSTSKGMLTCYVTGDIAAPADKHPKGINQSTHGAKLISCNDETNYTYKGRFTKAEQANAISAQASHKAHAMLKFLIATQGYKCDSQAVVAWAIDDGSALPDPFEGSLGLLSAVTKTDTEKQMDAQWEIAADYAKQLRLALGGRGKATALNNRLRRIAVMAVDAATTGRMSITFYQALDENEYIERVIAWHESCSWYFRGKDGRLYISAPSVDRIIAAVYGEPTGESYNKLKKGARERLLHHIVCGQPLDRVWMSAAVAGASQPFSYSKQGGGWDKGRWENALSVTCAIVRKYYQKEGLTLGLDKSCTDRSYLFGRLLAIADRLESHARYKQGESSTDKRATNAIRYMTAFASKPLRTWNQIYKQLNPYIQRLNGAQWYQRQIDEVMGLFSPEHFSDKPLDGKYLLGYSLQRLEFDSKNKNPDREDSFYEPDKQD